MNDSPSGASAVPDCGNGFETRAHSESAEQMADVVPDRLRAQMELLCDLLRRAALLEETENRRRS